MKIGSWILNGVKLRYCKALNHPEEAIKPAKTDNPATIKNFILKGIDFFSLNLDDIQILIMANKKNITAATRNSFILEKRLIRKICEKLKASNHK